MPRVGGTYSVGPQGVYSFLWDAGVFWPADADPLMRLTGTGIFGDPVPSSDHRLVWVDVSHGGFPKG